MKTCTHLNIDIIVKMWLREPSIRGRRLICIANSWNDKECQYIKIYKYADTNEVVNGANIK
jgi:hypothetical protein